MEPDPSITDRPAAAHEARTLHEDDGPSGGKVGRRARTVGSLVLAVAATAATIGITYVLLPGGARSESTPGGTRSGSTPGGTRSQSTPGVVPAPMPVPSRPSTYCGAPKPAAPVPMPTSTEAGSAFWANQAAVDEAAGKVDLLSGAGKSITRGWASPGKFARSYTGVVVQAEWRTLVVYRKPDPAFDAAVCKAVDKVTVELRESVLTAMEQNTIINRLMKKYPLGPGRNKDFTIYGVAGEPDGRIDVSVDNPEAARNALAGYGPYLVIQHGAPAVSQPLTGAA